MGVLQKALDILEKEKQAEKQAKEKSDNTVGDNTVMETPDDWWADENSDEDQTVVADESSEEVPPEEEVDVPEIETEITDLPPEDENEKVLDVDRTVVEEQPEVEEEPFDESSVMDPEEPGETAISDEELAGILNEPELKAEEPKAEEKVEEKKTEEPKEEEPKAEEPKAKEKKEQKKDAPKDNKTSLKRTTNKNQKSSSQYKHVPTPLRMAEDAGKATQTVLEDIGHVANTIGKQGTSGTSINDDVRSAVPHYDYRSLFR